MDISWRFDFWYRGLTASPTDEGRVCAIVRRLPGEHGQRERLECGLFTCEEGLVGDRWISDPHASETNQVTLINIHLLRELCEGDEERMALSGANLHVDLDLSEKNLPIGTQLRIGELLLEVTPEVHRPCRSFMQRFGQTAAKKVARGVRTGRRGRGVMCRVLESGEVRIGDTIAVKRPAADSDKHPASA